MPGPVTSTSQGSRGDSGDKMNEEKVAIVIRLNDLPKRAG